jgi:hypothetical protein
LITGISEFSGLIIAYKSLPKKSCSEIYPYDILKQEFFEFDPKVEKFAPKVQALWNFVKPKLDTG